MIVLHASSLKQTWTPNLKDRRPMFPLWGTLFRFVLGGTPLRPHLQRGQLEGSSADSAARQDGPAGGGLRGFRSTCRRNHLLWLQKGNQEEKQPVCCPPNSETNSEEKSELDSIVNPSLFYL